MSEGATRLMKHRSLRLLAVARWVSVALVLSVQPAIAHPPAVQRTVTVGQVAAHPIRCQAGSPGPYDAVQAATAAPPRYVMPARGVLTSWSTHAGADGGTLQLQVWRPTTTPDTYTLVAMSGPQRVRPGVRNTFHPHPAIGVRAGDLLGFRQLSNYLGCGELTDHPGDVWATNHAGGAAPTRGAIRSLTQQTNLRINISAALKTAGRRHH
jgi:hypothetical protein